MSGKTVCIRLDERLANRLERERRAQEAGLGRHLAMSSFLRRLLLLALDGPPPDRERAVVNAPISAPPEAVQRWTERVGRGEAARRLRDVERRRRLWHRFDAVCKRHGVKPPHFAQAIRQLDLAITPQVCGGWYHQGKLPEGEAGDDLERAIEMFVENLETKT